MIEHRGLPGAKKSGEDGDGHRLARLPASRVFSRGPWSGLDVTDDDSTVPSSKVGHGLFVGRRCLPANWIDDCANTYACSIGGAIPFDGRHQLPHTPCRLEGDTGTNNTFGIRWHLHRGMESEGHL